MGVGVIIRVSLLLLLAASTACTKKNPEKCESNADCEAPLSFCDVKGEFEESGYEPKTCTVRPADCPLERCGCEPGAALTCDVDQLTVCNEDGTSTSTTTCGLGCSTAEPRCLAFEPSNHLGEALTMGASEEAIVLAAGVRFDTDLGNVTSAAGMTIPVKSVVIPQTGGGSIRAFVARSFALDSATVVGSNAFALVAPGSIVLRGLVDASAEGTRHGPGAQDPPAVCAGQDGAFVTGSRTNGFGGAGAGNATKGGNGGAEFTQRTGGAPIPAFAPLVGGCRGGAYLREDGSGPIGLGGGGGGAVQLVSLDEVAFTNAGFIDVGGGGGADHTGGGSGGLIIIESPRVRLAGTATGMTANGGSGGGCGMAGHDGSRDAVPAQGPQCAFASPGAGGTGATTPGGASIACSGTQCFLQPEMPAGGGGAAGRIRIVTRTGNYETTGTPTTSAAISTATLTPR